MSALAQLPVTLIIAIVATIFVLLYRKHSKFYLMCWMHAWMLFLLHFIARDLRSIAAIEGPFLRALDVFSLQAAAYYLAVAGLRNRSARRMWLAAIMILLPVLALDVLWAQRVPGPTLPMIAIVAGYSAVASFLYHGERNRNLFHRLVLAGGCVTAAVVSMLAVHSGRTVLAITTALTLTFAEAAVQTWKQFNRRSAGVVTTVSALFGCALVFPFSIILPQLLPALQVAPDIWNVPKLFLAVGMLVVLFEDRMEAAINVSRRFRGFFEQAQEAIIIIDPKTETILEANPYACQMYAVKREGLVGSTLRGRTLNLAQGESAIADLIADGTVTNFETVHFRNDGQKLRILANGRLIDFNGKPAILAMMRDVTDLFATRETAARLANIVEHSQDAITSVTPAGIINTWNRGAEVVYGYSAEEAMGKHISMVFPRERTRDHQLIERLERGERIERYETERICKGGRRIWVSLSVSALRDEAGRFLGVAGSARDITLNHQAAEELRRREVRFANLVERSPFGIVIGCHGGELGIANEAFLKLIGYTKEEFAVGLINWSDISPASELERDNAALAEARANGTSGVYEKHFLRKNGSSVPAVVGCVALDEDCSDFAAFVADISDIKKASEEIARLARIIDTTSDAVISITRDDRVLTWNAGAEKLHGLTADEIVGLSAREVIPFERRAEWDNIREAILQGGRLEQFESMRKRKDGSLVPISMTISPVLDDTGKVIGISKIARDLTESKRAQQLEEQFRQAQKLEALGRLAGGIAHDFNNILMAVSSYAELIRDMAQDDEELIGYTSQLIKATSRGTSLTQQMLAFGRKQAFAPQVFELSDAVHDTAKMLRRLIGEDIELDLQLSDEPGHILADPGQLTQILMNLAVNARDAMLGGGTLTIGKAIQRIVTPVPASGAEVPAGDYAVLWVTDTGSGMTEATRNRIFEPFFTTKGVGKGTGLGLAVVYGIVTQSKAYISVESAPGKGATFRIYFPLHAAKKRTAAPVDVTTDLRPVAGHSLLLVEDEDALRESLALALRAKGYEVCTAADAAEAQQRAAANPDFDLLVTDVVMPRVTGFELARLLRQKRPELPVIFMSGYADTEKSTLDSADILRKPFAIAELTSRIQKILLREFDTTNAQSAKVLEVGTAVS